MERSFLPASGGAVPTDEDLPVGPGWAEQEEIIDGAVHQHQHLHFNNSDHSLKVGLSGVAQQNPFQLRTLPEIHKVLTDSGQL